jgi:hypothetical protein
MLVDMNSHLQQPLDKDVLQKGFNRGWPELREALDKIPKAVETPQPKSKVELMLEEILAYIRWQLRRDQQAVIASINRGIEEANSTVERLRDTFRTQAAPEMLARVLHDPLKTPRERKPEGDPPPAESEPKQPDQ